MLVFELHAGVFRPKNHSTLVIKICLEDAGAGIMRMIKQPIYGKLNIFAGKRGR